MSVEAEELLNIWAQLPEPKRVEVADFARFLLTRSGDAAPRGAMERWLAGARGAAKPGATTDEVMASTRGDS
jgi:hypothetical protein